MKTGLLLVAGMAVMGLLAGCESVPPGVERGPHGTIAYDVMVESFPPGARIEANGQIVGTAPLHLKIFGDKDGTFHDFGSYYYIVRALPVSTNQFIQTRVFRTGRFFTPEDPPAYPPPPLYGPPVYYGPGVDFYFGPRWRRW
jgi:hypothetical protein